MRPLIFCRARTASFIMPENTWLHRSHSRLPRRLTLRPLRYPPRPTTAANKGGGGVCLAGTEKDYAGEDCSSLSPDGAGVCQEVQSSCKIGAQLI